jgi:hypothetical protein
MSELAGLFWLYARAADKLLEEYDSRKSDLFKGETVTQFEFSHCLESLEWLDKRLPSLAENLLPAGFTLRLSIIIHQFQAIFSVREEGERLWVEVEQSGDYAGNDGQETFPEAAVHALMSFQEKILVARSGMQVRELYSLLEAVEQTGTTVQADLSLFLDKRAAQKRFLAGRGESPSPKLMVYLYPKSLSRALASLSLRTLEQEYFLPSHQSVWLVFSMQGSLESDYLSICGHGSCDRLDEILLNGKLDEDALRSNLSVINLRRLSGNWVEPPRWLTPDVFNLYPAPVGDEIAFRELVAQIENMRAMLSALYLADQVEENEDCFRVSYRGLGSTSFWLGRTDIKLSTAYVDDLYALFSYAFAGFSPDKVEIAQQFISLMVETSDELIQKAEEVREATQKTYQDRVLVEKVRDYFGARQKVQERLWSATENASEEVIELSREVSGDVYKIAGVAVAAVVAAFIQPNITLFAGIAAAFVLSVYLALVLFYHLPTLQRANQLSYQGHKSGIRSFGDVLSLSEIEGYLKDEQLSKALALFDQTFQCARRVYWFFFLIALLILILMIFALLG